MLSGGVKDWFLEVIKEVGLKELEALQVMVEEEEKVLKRRLWE